MAPMEVASVDAGLRHFLLPAPKEKSKAEEKEKPKTIPKWKTRETEGWTWLEEGTVGQNRGNHRINSHPIIKHPMSEGVSEVSERTNE